MNRVIEWLAENLLLLTENDGKDNQNFNYLFHILDIITIICIRINGTTKSKSANISESIEGKVNKYIFNNN